MWRMPACRRIYRGVIRIDGDKYPREDAPSAIACFQSPSLKAEFLAREYLREWASEHEGTTNKHVPRHPFTRSHQDRSLSLFFMLCCCGGCPGRGGVCDWGGGGRGGIESVMRITPRRCGRGGGPFWPVYCCGGWGPVNPICPCVGTVPCAIGTKPGDCGLERSSGSSGSQMVRQYRHMVFGNGSTVDFKLGVPGFVRSAIVGYSVDSEREYEYVNLRLIHDALGCKNVALPSWRDGMFRPKRICIFLI